MRLHHRAAEPPRTCPDVLTAPQPHDPGLTVHFRASTCISVPTTSNFHTDTMFETSSDDLFLPAYHEDVVDKLLSNEESGGDCGLSLANALLPLVESSSPPLLPFVCSTRYKTELCTSYSASSSCKYAERCQFAHGLHELHVPSRHPKYKTELCRSYHTTGYCYYGSRCLFVHKPEEQRPCQRRKKNVPCRTFRAFGVCPFGTHCNFMHVEVELGSNPAKSTCVEKGLESPCLYSPQVPPHSRDWKPRGALCRTFSSFGFCLFGTSCRFQHGLPNKISGAEPSPGHFGLSSQGSSGLPSPWFSQSSSSSTSSSPPTTPHLTTPSPDATANNAFTFSSQHLSELLLPLALHLQKLETTKAQEIWDNRAL